ARCCPSAGCRISLRVDGSIWRFNRRRWRCGRRVACGRVRKGADVGRSWRVLRDASLQPSRTAGMDEPWSPESDGGPLPPGPTASQRVVQLEVWHPQPFATFGGGAYLVRLKLQGRPDPDGEHRGGLNWGGGAEAFVSGR